MDKTRKNLNKYLSTPLLKTRSHTQRKPSTNTHETLKHLCMCLSTPLLPPPMGVVGATPRHGGGGRPPTPLARWPLEGHPHHPSRPWGWSVLPPATVGAAGSPPRSSGDPKRSPPTNTTQGTAPVLPPATAGAAGGLSIPHWGGPPGAAHPAPQPWGPPYLDRVRFEVPPL